MNNPNNFNRLWYIRAYLWAADQLYHAFAWAYDAVAWGVSFGHWADWRLDALQALQPGNVLEVGFGTGALLMEMTTRGMDVIGLELSSQMHRVVGRKLQRSSITVKRIRGRAEAMPFAEAIFANVLVTFPSNYIAHDATLDEIHRVLGEAGRLVIVGLGVRFKSSWKRWLTGWFLGDESSDLINQYRSNAEQYGFIGMVIEHETPDYTLPILILERQDAP